MRLAILVVPLIGIVSACDYIPIGQPDWVANRRPLPACGTERLSPTGGMDREARECLLEAWEGGDEAELITAATTDEGNLVTRYLRVYADGTIEQILDATQDAYGSGRWERLECDAISAVDDDDLVFVEQGCEPVPLR